MLNKNISVVKYKEMLEKQLEEENKKYLDKLTFIVNNPKTYTTSRVVDMFKLWDYDNLTDEEIKKIIDKLYNSFSTKNRRK